MARKRENLKKIDVRPTIVGGGSLVSQDTPEVPPAIVGGIPEPTNLQIVSQTVARSTQSPQKYANLVWDTPEHVTVDNYLIYSSTSSDFSNPEINQSSVNSAAILVDVGKTYYFKVRAVVRTAYSDFSNTVSATITADTTLPPDVTVASAVFNGGALVISYVEPSGSIYKYTRIRIYNAARTVLYGTFYSSGGTFVWSEDENISASNGGVSSVSIDLNSVSWSNVNGNTITITSTVVKPVAVSNVITDFSSGNLYITYDNTNTGKFKSVNVKLYNDNTKAQLYRTIDTLGNVITYTYSDNIKDVNSANTGDNSIYYEIVVQAWLGVASDIVSGTAIKPLPDTPTITTNSWSGDTGTASADFKLAWNQIQAVKEYKITITDGTTSATYTIPNNEFNFTHNLNKIQFGSYGKPSFNWSVVAVDYLNKSSTAVSGTATNASPTITGITATTVSNFGDYSILLNTGTTLINDFDYYEYLLYEGTVASGVLKQTVKSRSTSQIFQDLGNKQYQAIVRLVDVFNQRSSNITTDLITVKALDLDELRLGAEYYTSSGIKITDSYLKDGVINITESPVNYKLLPATTVWDYYLLQRPTIDRYGAITLGVQVSNNLAFYFSTSSDGGVTWTFWNFISTFKSGEPLLVKATSESNAQTTAASYMYAATSAIKYNYVFSEIVEARQVRFHFKSLTGTSKLTEFYARRLLESDDIRAESIIGIQIAANTITGSNIAGTTLSAIKTFTGTLDINQGGYVKAGMTGYNTGGVGYFLGYSGTTPVFAVGNPSGTNMTWNGTTLALVGGNFIIKTQNSGNRVEINSNGFYGYDSSNTLQVQVKSSDGTLTWGASLGELGSNGIRVDTGSESTLTVLGSSNPLSLINIIDSIKHDLGSYVLTATASGTKTNIASIGAKRLAHVYGFTNTVPQSPIGKRYNVTYISSPTVTVGGVSYEGLISLNAQTIVNTLNVSTLNANNADINNIVGNVTLTGSLGINTYPSINLAIGDSDTGFGSAGDGDVTIYANAQPIAKFAYNTYPGFYIDPGNINSGNSLNNGLRFGAYGSGEGIASARNAGNFNQFGIDFYTGYNLRGYFQSGGSFNVLYGASLASVALGTASNNRTPIVTMRGAVSNDMQLEFATYRFAAGTDWTTSTFIAQRKVDASYQRYISWGVNGIGIGVLNAAYPLEVSGDAAKDSGGSWAIRSDIKTKQNIVKVSDGLNKILSLPDVVEFEYNGLYGTEYTGTRYIGFIANELEKIDSRLVSAKFLPRTEGEKPERILYMNPDALHYWSINAIKQLHARIMDLEEKLHQFTNNN